MANCVAAGNEAVVTEGGGATVILKALLDVTDLVSVTCTVKLLVPLTVGTPEMTPVPAASVNPVGAAPVVMDHV